MRTNHQRSKVVSRVIGAVLGAVAVAGAVVGARAGLEQLRVSDAVAIEESTVSTSTAERRDLSETFTATGTLQFDEAIDITTPNGGTVLYVIEAGVSVGNGELLALVDDQSVVWLDGEIPAWRTIESGDEGDDVLQLETALTALGFNADNDVTVDDEYTSATAAMVEEWQESMGVESTGSVEFGTVVFGGNRTRVALVAVAVGDAVSEGMPVLAVGSDSRHAVLDAAPSEAVTLTVGDDAVIELPDRSEITGTVAAVAAGSETWQVTVAFAETEGFPATDVTNVEMSWAYDIAADVLTIPSSALLRLDSGDYTVAVVNDDGTTSVTPVSVGVAVGTRVEIVGGLAQGTTVVTL